MASKRVTRKHQTKNAWINSSFGVFGNIENRTSNSDIEIEEIHKKTQTNVQIGTTSGALGLPYSRAALALPLGRDDLAVHKKKVDEVDAWLLKAYSRPTNSTQPMILLITGPTGAGKTVTLQVLASSRQIHIVEWTNPMDELVESDGRNYGPSQASKFEDFLITSARYNPVVGPGPSQKLVLVEDYPNSLLLNPELFHNIIRKYQQMGKSPLVFITTEVNSGQKIAFDLFPPQFVNELNIQHISFNPIAPTSLMKALGHIIKHESRINVSLDMQNAICHACNGDIRNAVLALHYLAQDSSKVAILIKTTVPKSRKRKAEGGKRKSVSNMDNIAGLEGKDCLTGMMHSVGRVLHAKREVNVARGAGIDTDKRGFLKSDPQEIVNQFLSQYRHFVSIIHENYHSIFSDIHSAAKAIEHICDSDIVMSDWRERDLLKELGFSIAVRGVMNACNNPVHRWNPLQKPKWKEIMLKTNQHLKNMQCLSSNSSFSKQALCMDFAPFHGSHVKSNPFLLSENVESTPMSPLPHITDDDSD